MRSYHSLLCYQWYKLTFPPFQNLKLLSSFLLTLTTDSSVVARTEQMLSILSHFNAFPYSLRQERRKRIKKTADWGQGGGGKWDKWENCVLGIHVKFRSMGQKKDGPNRAVGTIKWKHAKRFICSLCHGARSQKNFWNLSDSVTERDYQWKQMLDMRGRHL